MNTINAARIESFGATPHYGTVRAPEAAPGQEVVEVLAVGLHPVTRSIASGQHYASPTELPFTPGIDAVVKRADGTLAYVGGHGSATLAERICIDPRNTIALPGHADPATVAASMNPAMSSWLALHARVPFAPGQSVLVIGATGNAGSLAVKAARHLGAGHVIAAGRNLNRLQQLLSEGVDEVVVLSSDDAATASSFAAAAGDVDVVLDYVWGTTSELAMRAMITARRNHAQLLDWVHIGGMGGHTISIDGALLRSNALRIVGSGLGSVDLRSARLPELGIAVASGILAIEPRPVPLATISEAWFHIDAPGTRTVMIP